MMYEPGSKAKETPGLEEYLAAIRQRKLLIISLAILGLIAGILFAATRAKSFEAEARVLVNPTPVGSIDNRLVQPSLEQEREVVDSNQVAAEVAADLGITTSSLDLLRDLEVVFVDRSSTLELNFIDSDPRRAQDIVNSFAQNYVDRRNLAASEVDETTLGLLTATQVRLQESLDASDIEIADLERQRNIAQGPDVQSLNTQIADLRSDRNSIRFDLRQAENALSTAQIAQDTRTPPGVVLQNAATPTVPTGFSDNILRVLGLILGLSAGVGLAFVLQRLDRTARESGDVELALGTSVLSSIPSFGLANRSGSSAIIMLSGGRSARVQRSREAFRRLRSSVQFLGTTHEAQSFLITSARPSEGKSTTTANLAIALAQGETKVCLVNADLRRPVIERVLGIPGNQRGLGDWLSDPTITNIMVTVPGTPGLVVVPAGPPPPNPGELFATSRFGNLIAELTEQFDIVLVDAPPVLNIADASAIAPTVDGTIVVVDSSRTDTDTLLKVRSEIERSGGHLVGAILNRDDSDGGGGVLRKDRYAYERVSAARASQ